jgi:hypothetical protein
MDDKSFMRSSSVASDEQGRLMLALIRVRKEDQILKSQFICYSEIDNAQLIQAPDDFDSYEDTSGPVEMTPEFIMENLNVFEDRTKEDRTKEDRTKEDQTKENQNVLLNLNRQINGEPVKMRSTTFAHMHSMKKVNPNITISNFNDIIPASKSLNKESVELVEYDEEQDQPRILPRNKASKPLAEVKNSHVIKSLSNSKRKKKAADTPKMSRKRTRESSYSKSITKNKSGFIHDKTKNTKHKSKIVLKWNLWDRTFSPQGLGGHKAKAHPGENMEYKAKQKVRAKNEEKRNLLRLAQRYYYMKFSGQDIHPKKINRMRLEKLKKEINDDTVLKEMLMNSDWEDYLKQKKTDWKLEIKHVANDLSWE